MTIHIDLHELLAAAVVGHKRDYLPIKAMINSIHDIQLDVFSEGCPDYAEITFRETQISDMCEMTRECADYILVRLLAEVEMAKNSDYEINLWFGEDNALMLDRSFHIRKMVNNRKAEISLLM